MDTTILVDGDLWRNRIRLDIDDLSDHWLRHFLGHFIKNNKRYVARFCGHILAVNDDYEVHAERVSFTTPILSELNIRIVERPRTAIAPGDGDILDALFKVEFARDARQFLLNKGYSAGLGFDFTVQKNFTRVNVSDLDDLWLARFLVNFDRINTLEVYVDKKLLIVNFYYRVFYQRMRLSLDTQFNRPIIFYTAHTNCPKVGSLAKAGYNFE